MVRAFFKNGQQGEAPKATSAKITRDEQYPMTHLLLLICLDAQDREVGRFKWDELVGYAIDSSP